MADPGADGTLPLQQNDEHQVMQDTNEEWPVNRPLEKVCEPDENDVLFLADSSLAAQHEGNACFIRILEQHQEEYQLKSQLEQPMVALDILHEWRNKGGRFLKYEEKTRLWNDIGDKKARQRISRALKNQGNDDGGRRNSSGVSDVSEEATEEESDSRRATSRRISTRLNYAREGKLYGREKEKDKLVGVYRNLKQGDAAHFVLISGESGIGKTALAHSLRSLVEQDGGFFLQAKFEELSEKESTAVLVTALSDFARQLLHRDTETLDLYREVIQKVVDEEARVLTTLVPELVTILDGGENTISIEAGQGAQATKRIVYICQSFLRAIASTDRPLVILLDDLHWANESSLDVLTLLLSGIDGVLFLGTCRDNDSTNIRALNGMVTQLEMESVNVHRAELANLDEDSVRFMLADALLLESDQLMSVGHLVFSKTRGNVFFIMELLRSLQDDELLQFDETTQQWTCDSHLIQVTGEMQTVQELFKTKVSDLPVEVQEMLKIASCFGSKPDTFLLKLLMGANVSSYWNIAAARGLLKADSNGQTFAFAHDGIQQAIYSLIGDRNKPLFHLRIGQKLWRKLEEEDLEKHLFVVSRQLMLGDASVTKQEERAVLAALYLRAGEKAVELSNFETASVYLKRGTEMLCDDDWKDNYDLSLRLHNASAEVSYCIAQFADVSKSVNVILLNARCFEDTLRARSTQIFELGSRNRQPEAIKIGLATLRELGEELPSSPSGIKLTWSMWRVKRLLGGMSDEALMRLPVMKVARKMAAMQILNLIWLSAMYSRPMLSAAVAIRMVKLTVMYGKCAVSSVGFGFYAMLLCG
jgi:predicted ATPase